MYKFPNTLSLKQRYLCLLFCFTFLILFIANIVKSFSTASQFMFENSQIQGRGADLMSFSQLLSTEMTGYLCKIKNTTSELAHLD